MRRHRAGRPQLPRLHLRPLSQPGGARRDLHQRVRPDQHHRPQRGPPGQQGAAVFLRLVHEPEVPLPDLRLVGEHQPGAQRPGGRRPGTSTTPSTSTSHSAAASPRCPGCALPRAASRTGCRVDNRTIGDEFFRPSYTTGVWAKGQIVDSLVYYVMLGNNLSQLGVDAGAARQRARHLVRRPGLDAHHRRVRAQRRVR